MKKIKWLSILLASVILFSFSACEFQGETDGEATQQTAESNEEVTTRKEEATTDPSNNDPIEPDDGIITVACIGDSITWGTGLSDPDTQAYPAQLQNALGEEYKVYNWGKAGATMCSSSAPLYKSKNWFVYSELADTLESEAAKIDVALIMLGTNDGNSTVEQLATLFANDPDAFRADYKANLTRFVTTLRTANPNVVIYLMSSPKCFRTGDAAVWETNLQELVRPLEKSLAEELNLEWYDMYQFTAEQIGAKGFPDNLHPGLGGHQKMGWELAGVLAERFGTEVAPYEKVMFVQSDNFDSLPTDLMLTDKNSEKVEVGNNQMQVKVIEGATLTVDNGALALKKGTTDAWYNIMLNENTGEGKYRIEIEVKASEDLKARGCLFFMFGRQFARFKADKSIVSIDEKTVLGTLATDRFMKLTLDVDTVGQTYVLYIDGTQVLAESFEYKEAAFIRPVQFFAGGTGTVFLNSYSITQTE